MEKIAFRTVRLDSKGRISIPAAVRRNFGLWAGSEILMLFDLKKNILVLVFENGRGGVASSTAACGAAGPGETPGPGPLKKKGV